MARSPRVKKAFSADKIEKRVRALGKKIRKDAGDGDILLLGILRGASVFRAGLMRGIPGEVSYGFIDVVRDISDTETATALEIDFITHTELAGRNVYVLKDVVSTGVIENYLLQQLRLHDPASVHLVALLDRPDLRTVEIEADYRAFKVSEGSFVGYGLEIAAKYANLPYIGRI